MVGFSFDEIWTRRNRICTTRFLDFGAIFSPVGKFCAGTKARTRPGGPDALPVILHGILHFSRKALLFAPKGGTILLLVPTRFCGRMRRKSAWCGQNGRDETACFDPGGAQTALGTQNSKCDRALTAPPEFKSLMLRQRHSGSVCFRSFLLYLYQVYTGARMVQCQNIYTKMPI